MRGVSAFVWAALTGGCAGRERNSTVYFNTSGGNFVVRSVPESVSPPTEFCAKERTGIGRATYEGQYTQCEMCRANGKMTGDESSATFAMTWSYEGIHLRSVLGCPRNYRLSAL